MVGVPAAEAGVGHAARTGVDEEVEGHAGTAEGAGMKLLGVEEM